MIRVTYALFPALLVGCASQDGSIRQQIEAAQAVERQQEVETRRLALDLNRLLADFAAVDAEYKQAADNFQLTSQAADHASPQFAVAEQDYESAEQSYRWSVYVLMVAAAHDAVMGAADKVCAGVESTRAYRRENGIDDSNVCVDHVFPHALGGVNSPLNYQPLACSTNSSLGASFWEKLTKYPAPMLGGLAATALARLRCAQDAAAWRR